MGIKENDGWAAAILALDLALYWLATTLPPEGWILSPLLLLGVGSGFFVAHLYASKKPPISYLSGLLRLRLTCVLVAPFVLVLTDSPAWLNMLLAVAAGMFLRTQRVLVPGYTPVALRRYRRNSLGTLRRLPKTFDSTADRYQRPHGLRR